MKCMEPNSGTEVCPHCGYAGERERLPHVLRPGTILKDQYLLGEPLGQGGFGITYIARDLNLDIRVAIKEYYPNGYAVRNISISDRVTITDERMRLDIQKGKDSFLKEARTLARFRETAGIVDVLNFFEANDTAYIVMEYLDGETLGHRLKRKLFTAAEIFERMGPVFNTLEKIHMQDVVHRDISPDNIMIMPDGSLKLMDFGAARLMNYVDQRSVSVVLKAGYAPLEQYSTKGEQGPWTDVYALCATIYKCITGKTPADPHDRLMGEAVPWPSELGLPISVRQENALKQGMAIFLKDRFQTIGELRSTLRKEDSDSMVSGPITLEPKSSDDRTVALPRKQQTPSAEKKPVKKPQKEPEAKPQQDGKQSRVKPAQKKEANSKKRRSPYLWIGGAVLGLIVLSLVLVALLDGKQKKGAVGTLASAETPNAPETSLPTLATTPASTADTPDPVETDSTAPTVVLSDDPNALIEPTAEMIAGAVGGELIKSDVSLLHGPSTNTTIIATGLKSGTKLTVYAEDGEFYFLMVNETKKYGYISKKFVTLLSALGETSTGSDQPEGTVRGTISASNLALREGPGVTNKSLGQYYEGKLVYIYHQEGDYYYVLVAGTDVKGYMSAQFIKVEEGKTVPKTPKSAAPVVTSAPVTPRPATPTPTPTPSPTPTLTPTAQMSDWTEWSTYMPPAEAAEWQAKTQYRYRENTVDSYTWSHFNEDTTGSWLEGTCRDKQTEGNYDAYYITYNNKITYGDWFRMSVESFENTDRFNLDYYAVTDENGAITSYMARLRYYEGSATFVRYGSWSDWIDDNENMPANNPPSVDVERRTVTRYRYYL